MGNIMDSVLGAFCLEKLCKIFFGKCVLKNADCSRMEELSSRREDT